jgi:hypothetical protein
LQQKKVFKFRIFSPPQFLEDSVLDRHRSDADPEPNFYFDADPNPDPEWQQNDADPHADPTPSFTHVGT